VASAYPGFPAEGLKFFRQLERNNNRDWFEAHKEEFVRTTKEPMEALVDAVGARMVKWAPEYVTAARKAIYRIYRDTRFSNDKTPYKTHLGASFFRNDLGRHIAGGFYFEVSHRYLGLASGIYMPDADNLRVIRGHIVENAARWEKIMGAPAARKALGELQGDKLSRPPKGFPADSSVVEWLKMKAMYYWVELDAKLVTGPGVVELIDGWFKKAWPTIEFLNEPLLAAKKKRGPLEEGWV
jgi:uncharacterized protein (TIGR02453 family)